MGLSLTLKMLESTCLDYSLNNWTHVTASNGRVDDVDHFPWNIKRAETQIDLG